jgi:hypothetical protein
MNEEAVDKTADFEPVLKEKRIGSKDQQGANIEIEASSDKSLVKKVQIILVDSSVQVIGRDKSRTVIHLDHFMGAELTAASKASQATYAGRGSISGVLLRLNRKKESQNTPQSSLLERWRAAIIFPSGLY